MTARETEVLQTAVRILKKELNPPRIFLFGSRATDHRSSHVYDKQEAVAIFTRIRNAYLPAVKTLISRLEKEN